MKKQSLLLFKNAFKQAFRNKIQLVGLVVLVLLSSTIFSLMQTSLTRISNEYHTLVAESNLHDFVIDYANTSIKTVNDEEKVNALSKALAVLDGKALNNKQSVKDTATLLQLEANKVTRDNKTAIKFVHPDGILTVGTNNIAITFDYNTVKNKALIVTVNNVSDHVKTYQERVNDIKNNLAQNLDGENFTTEQMAADTKSLLQTVANEATGDSKTTITFDNNDQKLVVGTNNIAITIDYQSIKAEPITVTLTNIQLFMSGILEPEQPIINNLANQAGNGFIWDRVEGRTMQLDNNGNQRLLKLLTYNSKARIDKLIVNQGYNIGDSNNPDKKTPVWKQTVLNKEFAQKNNLKIGDTIRVQQDELGNSLKVSNYDINDGKYSNYNWLKIVGYGVSADFTTPIIDKTTSIPNKIREGILYVDPQQFGLSIVKDENDSNYKTWYNRNNEKITITSNVDREIYFVGKAITDHKNNLNLISKALRKKYVNTVDSDAKLVYALGDSNYTFNNRTGTLNATVTAFKTLLIALLLIVLSITGMTVILITYKNIDNTRTQIGILKSLGYSNIKILFTSLAYPMVAAFIGTILVFFPASALQLVVVNSFANYFNLDFGKFIFDAFGFLYCLMLTFGFLSLIAWFISGLTVIKNPITLIKNESVTANSRFSRIVKKSSINHRFLTRFRLSLFTSSIGKMAAASLTMFLGTTLMTAAILGPKIMSDNKLVSYTGMNYKSTVEYNLPTYNSPFTMYKTYNPHNADKKKWEYKEITNGSVEPKYTYWRPDRSDPQTYINELVANDINAEAYAPMSLSDSLPDAITGDLAMNSLTFLYGKMLTKEFLVKLDQSQFSAADFIAAFIAPNAWPIVVPIYNILKETDNSKFYSDETYNILRKFYQNYRSTIAMTLNNKVTSNDKSTDNLEDWDATKFTDFALKELKIYHNVPNKGKSFAQQISDFAWLDNDKTYHLHLADESKLLANKVTVIEKNEWINKISIWFSSIFYGRVGQTVVQGAYSRSPYFIRQNLAKSYTDKDSLFNISFNVLPFDKTTDELGTYFTGLPQTKNNVPLTFNDQKYPIKVYGLQSQAQLGKDEHGNNKLSMMQLYDENGVALNPLLEQPTNTAFTNIIINKTIAKQLHLKVDDDFTMDTNGNVMAYKSTTTGKYKAFAPEKVSFDSVSENDNDNNVTLLNQNTTFNDDEFSKKGQSVYSNINIAPPILEEVTSGGIVNQHKQESKTPHFKVVGIYNGYGQPNAYISKTKADKLLHYDQTRAMLFRLFKVEWEKHEQTGNFLFPDLATMNYEDFLKINKSDKNYILVQMFDSEYPIFNFKFSNSDALPDITNTFSTSQIYGDYSALGLNGGTEINSNKVYQGYGAGSAVNITPQAVHRQLLNQITALVDTILAAFIAFSLIISFFIILLTSNLVIYENRKTIATMKTLGYSDAKITNIVIGMYLPVIAAMFLLGFPVGWLIVNVIINFLAAHTTWVLPLFFTWWLPIVVGVIVLGIYVSTFIIDWFVMKKINVIKILNEID